MLIKEAFTTKYYFLQYQDVSINVNDWYCFLSDGILFQHTGEIRKERIWEIWKRERKGIINCEHSQKYKDPEVHGKGRRKNKGVDGEDKYLEVNLMPEDGKVWEEKWNIAEEKEEIVS